MILGKIIERNPAIVFGIGFLFLLLGGNCSGREIEEKSPSGADPVSHDLWDKVLDEYVSPEGWVDYKGLKEDRSAFDRYTERLSGHHPDQSWSRKERLAYWINAYNAFTLQLVLKHYPVNSIKDIGGLVKGPWKQEFIEIEGKTYTLHDIEHNILRANYDEPRIHFAVNCASVSCPVLLDEAYTAENLETQLDRQARRFINDEMRNRISEDELRLSKIFQWYEEDFTRNGTLAEYIDRYAEESLPLTEEGQFKGTIRYLEYNWALNEQENRPRN